MNNIKNLVICSDSEYGYHVMVEFYSPINITYSFFSDAYDFNHLLLDIEWEYNRLLKEKSQKGVIK